jgi:DNA-binding NarL/FixJ family response regulator
MEKCEMTILIVEDHLNMSRMIKEWLEDEFSQFNFVLASNAMEAINFCRNVSPRLVIMDINLPDISGIDAISDIKAMRPLTDVVMLTIHENVAYREAAEKAGASAYVTKRELYEDLIPVLNSLLYNENQNRFEQ